MLTAKVQRAIEESVERLLSITTGDFERTAGRPVFKEITDGLLIELRQVVINAGAAVQPKALSGLAQKRLMLWVVLDCLRSPVVLSGAAADRAGGRIWKQAERQSAEIDGTAAKHATERDTARAAAAADPDSQVALVTELAAIDAAETFIIDMVRREVYTGLTEVEPEAIPVPPPAVLPVGATTIATPSTSTSVRYPWLIHSALTPFS